MKLKKINDIKPISRVTDRAAKKTQTEMYINTSNEKFYKKNLRVLTFNIVYRR